MESQKKIAILDFGGQYSHLIASRIRRIGAFTEICQVEESLDRLRNYAGIVLSGGPSSVYEPGAPLPDPGIYQLGIPVLGICYGMQCTVHLLGGKVEKSRVAEYGPAQLQLSPDSGLSPILKGLVSGKIVWMSHGDEVRELPEGFQILASSPSCAYAIVGDEKRRIYGIQFHPEVTHTEQGNLLLKNFIQICGVSDTWGLDHFLQEEIATLRQQVGEDKRVFLLVSGGVDSTVAYILLAKALGSSRVKGLLIDTGFMRKNEVNYLKENLGKIGFDLWVRDESENFYRALVGITDPEEKRNIVGNLFLEAQKRAVQELELDPHEWLLGQGTIYPDTIESGGTRHSQKIKTHHNRVPAIRELLDSGKVVEPLRDLYKDEVRELGVKLGLSREWAFRHPFPGPGLVVRMIASRKEVPGDLETGIWKFLVEKVGNRKGLEVRILPFPSVGVQGDQRTYANCVLLNDFTEDWEELASVSTAITNHFREVNRVVFAPAEKHLDTDFIYREVLLDKYHSDLLREVDWIVMQSLRSFRIYDSIWQMPVVLVPCSRKEGRYSVVLRPVDSTEAMTASFYQMEREILFQIREKILSVPEIDCVFYDLTNKPPGTIEWE